MSHDSWGDDASDERADPTIDALMNLVKAPSRRGDAAANALAMRPMPPVPRSAPLSRLPNWLRLLGVDLRREAQRR